MPKKPVKIPGANLPRDLKEPIQLELTTGIGLWGSRLLTRAERAQQVAKKVANRFDAIMKHYEIPTNSSDRWTHLSFRLADELGMMAITLEQPKGPGAPRIWSTAGSLLIERMDAIIRERSLSRTLDAAKILIGKYPDDYKDLTAKSLANRYGEAKQQKGLSLSASLAERRAAVGQQLRQLRAKRRLGRTNALCSREKYWAAILRRLQETDK